MLISPSNRKNIVITAGDPSGVGPEVTLKALASRKVKGLANFIVIGPRAGAYPIGRVSAAGGRAAISYIDRALELLKNGRADALVTSPVSKEAMRAAGLLNFEGHTEYLAKESRTKDFAMMFVGKRLKITLVTRHIALKDVPRCLTAKAVFNTILLTHKYLKIYFGIRRPRIGVAGLNPHAGESGLFGDEESSMINPAIKKSRGLLGNVYGPIPADVIFHKGLENEFDAIVAMYHDQALAPFKMLYFLDGVNITLGLPFVRTSPDHGTAFDIAGKGLADPTSMIEAIRLACRLA